MFSEPMGHRSLARLAGRRYRAANLPRDSPTLERIRSFLDSEGAQPSTLVKFLGYGI